MVVCTKCKTEYETYVGNFHRDRGKKSGYECRCKHCKAKADNKIQRAVRESRRYISDKVRMDARTKAQKTWNISTLSCAVLDCPSDAQELHHVDYEQPLSVVPLCKRHHSDWHRTATLK